MFAGDIICQCPEDLNTVGSLCRTSTDPDRINVALVGGIVGGAVALLLIITVAIIIIVVVVVKSCHAARTNRETSVKMSDVGKGGSHDQMKNIYT